MLQSNNNIGVFDTSSAPPLETVNNSIDQNSLSISMHLSEMTNQIVNPKYNTIHASVETDQAREYKLLVEKRRSTTGAIDVGGVKGNNGQSGRPGKNGRPGRAATARVANKIGDRGENGEHGTNGEDGYQAENGRDGDVLNILLDRSSHPQELLVKYSREPLRANYIQTQRYGYNANIIDEHRFNSSSRFPLNSPNEFVIFRSNGGDGGNGGNGGHGGNGGSGGHGANGEEQGGDGGDGGNGGDGGRASYGGHGGSAGFIFINTYDPRLLVLTRTETRGGRGGKIGICGEYGVGGNGGSAGHGLIKGGRSGRAGANGTKQQTNLVHESQNGSDGITVYRVLDFRTNQIMFEGQKSFTARILSFDVEANDDDGIFEPGEDITLKNFKIHNDGDIPLPAGSILRISYDPSGFIFSEDQYILPEIAPKQTLTLTNATLTAKILPNALKTSELSKNISLNVQVDMFDRIFDESIMGCNILVQYPISITNVDHLTQMGRGDASDVIISFTNLSKRPYQFLYNVITHDQLFLVETEQRALSLQSHIKPENINMHPHSVILGYCSEFYQKQKIEIELLYKDTVIQKVSKYIQAVPHFNPTIVDTTDVLLITNNTFGREDFKAFSEIFQLLNIRPNFWDLDFYKGISYQEDTRARHAVSCVDKYRGKLIILCAKNIDDVQKFMPMDLIYHFGHYEVDQVLSSEFKSNSGLLVLTPEVPKKEDMKKVLGDPHVATHVTEFDSDKQFCGYYKLLYPAQKDVNEKCKELEAEKEKNSIERYVVNVDNLEIKQVKSDSWISWKYSYGKASMFKLNVNIFQTLVGLTFNSDSNYDDFGIISDQTTGEIIDNPKVIDLLKNKKNSVHFNLFYSIAYSLGLESKLKILQELDGKTETSKLVKDLVIWTLFESVKRETRLGEAAPPILEQLVHTLTQKPHLTCESTLATVIQIFERACSFTYYGSFVPSSLSFGYKFKEKRTEIMKLSETADVELRRAGLEAINKKTIPYFDIDNTILKAKADTSTTEFPKLRDVSLMYLIE